MHLSLEDFAVGMIFLTGVRTITEGDVMDFAKLSGDFNPLHTGEEFGKAGRFGKRIAHGFLNQKGEKVPLCGTRLVVKRSQASAGAGSTGT